MSLSEYKDIFNSEAREYIQTLNDCLLDMENSPDELTQLDEMFRAAHSLKGMAGTMGYEQITSLTHHMESIFDALRSGKVKAEKRVLNLLFESLDVLESLLDLVVEGQEEEDVSSLTNRLKNILEAEAGDAEGVGQEIDSASGEKAAEKVPEIALPGKVKGEQFYLTTVEISKECLLKSVRAYMVLKELKNLGTIVKSLPGEQDLEAGIFGDSFQVILQTKVKPEVIKKTIGDIAEIDKVTVDAYEAPEQKKKKPGIVDEQQKALLKKTSEKIIRVETEKLDLLISLAGELVVNRTRVIELSKNLKDTEMKNSLEQLDLITTNLQNAIMKLRMVSIKQVFDRFPRLVRDFSESHNKKVNLVIRGEETELDRSIVNVIGEPLTHMVRNALDHGIERMSDRKRLGKPETSTLKLSARHEGSHVVIEVEDDGCGIDPRKIKTKALEKGIKSTEELEKMTDEDIIKLIFHSGFSTAEEVSDVSGRGVGMDAVKSTIETLHGEVSLESQVGKGTKFIIKLPLTLAIIKAMLVQVGSDIFAIPVESIRENIYVSPQEVKKVQNRKVISFRNQILRLIDLGERLKVNKEDSVPLEEQEIYPVVVVEAGDKKAGLIVETLLGQQEIVIKSLGKIVEGMKGIAGATVLANGEVALILDVSSLID